MKTEKIIATLLALSLTAFVALVGCGKKTTVSPVMKTSSDVTAVNMDSVQFLNGILNSEPKTLDRSLPNDISASDVLVNCMEGLTRIEQGEDGKDVIKPAGAERWEASLDETIWTFHLRDYKWSDGKAVTANDFEYAIKRALEPEVGPTNGYMLFPIKNAQQYSSNKAKAEEVGVKALDAKTLQFTLDKPCPFFLDLTYIKVMLPQREDIVNANGDKYGTEANTMVFCGPYILKNWAHQSKMEFIKNPTYWDKDSVKLEKLTLNIIKEETSRMKSLSNGTIDYATVTKREWMEKFNLTDKFNVIKVNTPGTNYIFFNQKDKYFANAKIRQAFSLAVDREERVKTINRGLAQPAYGYCPPTLQIGGEDFRSKVAVEPLKSFKAANPDAKTLLIAGLKEIGANPDPSKNIFTYLQYGTDVITRENAEYDKQMYKKNLGVDLKLEYIEWVDFLKRIDDMNYQMGSMAWIGDYNDPNTFFEMWATGADLVPTGWSNEKYDTLIKQAAGTTDVAKRTELFKQAEKILVVDDAVISPLAYRMKNTFRYKYINRVMTPLFGSQDFKYAYTNGRK